MHNSTKNMGKNARKDGNVKQETLDCCRLGNLGVGTFPLLRESELHLSFDCRELKHNVLNHLVAYIHTHIYTYRQHKSKVS